MSIVFRPNTIIETEVGWEEYFEIGYDGNPCSYKVAIYLGTGGLPHYFGSGPVIDWIKENVAGDWTIRKFSRECRIVVYYFNKSEDAVLFKLRWG